MSALTDWFGMSAQPLHEGVYEVTYTAGAGDHYTNNWALWKNGQWHLTSDTPNNAAEQTIRSISCYDGQIKGWRGLTNKADDFPE